MGWDTGTARERVRVARALGSLPRIDEALRTGVLSYAKARALTRVATPEIEGQLLAMALVATGAQLERLCRSYRSVVEGGKAPVPEERTVRRRLLPGGRVKVEVVLEADEADLVLRAVDRAREVNAEQADADISRLSHDPFFRGIKGYRSLRAAAMGASDGREHRPVGAVLGPIGQGLARLNIRVRL